jgi:hypothetical protein
MKSRIAGSIFVTAILVFAIVGSFANLVDAQLDYRTIGQRNPDAQTQPPTMTMFEPENLTSYYSDTLNISFTAETGKSPTAYKTSIIKVYYTADWLTNKTTIVNSYINEYDFITGTSLSNYTHNLCLNEIPKGRHTVTVTAVEMGLYERNDGPSWFDYFHMEVSATIQINKQNDCIEVSGVYVDNRPPPLITNISLENTTYNSSDVPLNFTVNGVVSEVEYSLDSAENVTIPGNTVLTGLTNGNHTLTLYAVDKTGHTETSETVFFSVAVPEPLPVWYVVAVSIVVIGTVLVILLSFQIKRRDRRKGTLHPGIIQEKGGLGAWRIFG